MTRPTEAGSVKRPPPAQTSSTNARTLMLFDSADATTCRMRLWSRLIRFGRLRSYSIDSVAELDARGISSATWAYDRDRRSFTLRRYATPVRNPGTQHHVRYRSTSNHPQSTHPPLFAHLAHTTTTTTTACSTSTHQILEQGREVRRLEDKVNLACADLAPVHDVADEAGHL